MKKFLVGVAIMALCSCKKEGGSNPSGTNASIPTLATVQPSNVTSSSFASGGSITSDGGSAVTARGICYNITPAPTTSGGRTLDGTGSGSFISTPGWLAPGTLYYVRAYASNAVGTAYGNEYTVTTLSDAPTVSIDNPVNIFSNQAFVGATVASAGSTAVIERGVCWSTSSSPTISDMHISSGTGLGYYGIQISNLTVNTTYYARAYATNSTGTGYSSEVSFTTAFRIGEGHAGGRIFYIDGSGLHGLVVALTDQSAGLRWDNTSGPFVSPTAFSYTNGISNTNKIIATLGNSGNAAAACRAYTGGGFTDWYLPARDELAVLYAQRNVMNNYQNSRYWCSTESSSYIGFAWSHDFGSGFQYDNSLKTSVYAVRAIRAF